MITNCNCAIEIECGCTVGFDTYSDNLYSALSVGNLVGDGCAFDAYVIDWYRNGEHAMTSGKNIPGLDAYHPFTGGAAIPVPAGTWTPVLRFVVMAGDMVFAAPAYCQKWCRTLQGGLPTITVLAITCDIVSGSPAAGYSFRIAYSTTQDYSFATRSISWEMPEDGSMKYLAVQFTTYTVPDQVQVFYRDEDTPLMQFWVGSDFAGTRGDLTPKQIDLQSLKFVVDLTGRVYQSGDYLTIKVRPSFNPNTIWGLDLKCLYAGAFDGQCDFFPLTIRDINPATFAMSFDAVNCRYVLNFTQNILPSMFASSNFNKYNTIMANSSSNDSTFNPTTGMATILLWDKVFCTAESLHTHYHVNSAVLISYAKVGTIFTFTFEHWDDYKAHKDWYNYNRSLWKFSNYSSDPTNINHYKIFQISWQEVATQCGDTYVWRAMQFHWLSPVTFDDTAKTMVIDFYPITNQYPDVQPRQKCDNTYDQIKTWVTQCQNTRSAADWSGSTRCREGRPINGVWIYQQIWNDLSKTVNWRYSLAVPELDNICHMTGWAQGQILAWLYEFIRWYLLVEITSPDDRANNFRVSTGLNRETGEITGVWERIYEMQGGIQIYP